MQEFVDGSELFNHIIPGYGVNEALAKTVLDSLVRFDLVYSL